MIKKELTYKGHKVYIAKHPELNYYLAYAVVPPNRYGRDILMRLEVHGGITFYGTLDHIGKPREYALGIDFGHYGDYSELIPELGGHKWTEAEVVGEAQKIVDEFQSKLIQEESE